MTNPVEAPLGAKLFIPSAAGQGEYSLSRSPEGDTYWYEHGVGARHALDSHLGAALLELCTVRATLAAEVERVKEELGLAHECFGMVRDALTQMTGRSHDDVPPMCLDDAVRNALSTLDATRGET